MCPEGGALLLTGTNGYLHLLTLKVTLPLLLLGVDVGGQIYSNRKLSFLFCDDVTAIVTSLSDTLGVLTT